MLRTDGGSQTRARTALDAVSPGSVRHCMPLPRAPRPSHCSTRSSQPPCYFSQSAPRCRIMSHPLCLLTRRNTSLSSNIASGTLFSVLLNLTTEIQTALRFGWARRFFPHGCPIFSPTSTVPGRLPLPAAPGCSSWAVESASLRMCIFSRQPFYLRDRRSCCGSFSVISVLYSEPISA